MKLIKMHSHAGELFYWSNFWTDCVVIGSTIKQDLILQSG